MPLTTLHVPQDRYRIDALLDQTEGSATYRAWDIESQKEVLLREFVPRHRQDPDALAQRRARIAEGAAVLRTLAHPHLVPVLDAFEENGNSYLVSHVLEGETLAERIQRHGALPEAHVVVWAHQLLDALAYCHDRGVRHGAITPAAVVIKPDGDAVLADLGLDLVHDATGESTHPHSDLADLGATLTHALTGQAPSSSADRGSARSRRSRAPRERQRSDSAVGRVLTRAMAPAVDDGWSDARAMAGALPPADVAAAPRQARAGLHRSQRRPRANPSGRGDWQAGPQDAKARRKRMLAGAGVLAGIVAIAVLVGVMLSRERHSAARNAVLPAAPVDVPVISSTVRTKDGMTLVFVPAGTFRMGSPYGSEDQRPIHTVTLDAFWIDQTEVTNAQYNQCVAAGACQVAEYVKDPSLIADPLPVVGVSWFDARAYCTWAGGRLPTEAEWEYAARGPENRTYPWGDDRHTGYANCLEDDCADGFERTAPVGSFPDGVSWVGALDMAGNVWEWVNDFYRAGYYGWSSEANPKGPEAGTARVLRGGGWDYNWANLRSANRGLHGPGFRNTYIGIRCAGDAAAD